MLEPEIIGAWPGKSKDGITHPALWHMLDVGAVANHLINNKPITNNKSWNQAIVFMIVLHDIGKISDCFWKQITKQQAPVQYHSELSFFILQHHDKLIETLIGGDIKSRRSIYAAVAGHHGGPPELDDGTGRNKPKKLKAIGDTAFGVTSEMIKSIRELFDEVSLEGLNSRQAKIISWNVSGLTIQSDWIGSNSNWFEFQPPEIPVRSYWDKARDTAKKAVSEAGLHHSSPRGGASILPEGVELRPMQREVKNLNLPDHPFMAIIEEATGSGKTESALILASRMMTSGKGNGIFFALPTMATSNAMFSRIRSVANKLFDGHPSLGLSHSRAGQNEEFKKILGNDGSDPNEPVTCGQWLADDRRRILLADIGVGTIDQALLAILPTRFNTLRLWALSDKIIIVDEAHSYDAYMEKQLQTLLKFHAMSGGSVILMTATLPQKIRKGYLEAFQRGLGLKSPSIIDGDNYPQLTIVSRDVQTHKILPAPATCREIEVERIDEKTAYALIKDGVSQGAACVWIRNAVDDAIEAVKELENRGIPSDLLHARFILADRLDKEKLIQGRFGREGHLRKGGVLVATQVVEASLDLDFDLMISDLAPIGSLIQRSGRLWRHMDLRPTNSRPIPGPKLNILSPDPSVVENSHWLSNVLKAGSYVYPLSDQWRTAQAIFSAKTIKAPNGIRSLIEEVHGSDKDVPEILQHAEDENIGKRQIQRQMAANIVLSSHQDGQQCDYLTSAQKIYDEEKVLTRLSIPQVTLRLARVCDGELVPFVESWQASEVQMSLKRYENAGRLDQDCQIISAIKSKWKKWEQSAYEVAIVAENGYLSPNLSYDRQFGLLIE